MEIADSQSEGDIEFDEDVDWLEDEALALGQDSPDSPGLPDLVPSGDHEQEVSSSHTIKTESEKGQVEDNPSNELEYDD